jgi:hypothetical protein
MEVHFFIPTWLIAGVVIGTIGAIMFLLMADPPKSS